MANLPAELNITAVLDLDNIGGLEPIDGALITICKRGTATPVADQLFSDLAMSVPLANPFTIGSDGLATVYVAVPSANVPGVLTVVVSDNGGTARINGVPTIFSSYAYDLPAFPDPAALYPLAVSVREFGIIGDGSDESAKWLTATQNATVLLVPPSVGSAYGGQIVLSRAGARLLVPGGATVRAATGVTKVVDVLGTATDAVIPVELTVDGNGIATYGVFAEDLAVRGRCYATITGIISTGYGFANADHNHSWIIGGRIYSSAGRGVWLQKHAQHTRIVLAEIYGNAAGQILLGDGATAMSDIVIGESMVEATTGIAAPNIQMSSPVNPLVVKGSYLECVMAAGTDLTIDPNLQAIAVCRVNWENNFQNGNSVALYAFVIGASSQTFLRRSGNNAAGFVTDLINDGTAAASLASRFIDENLTENAAAITFRIRKGNPIVDPFTLTDVATVAIDASKSDFLIHSASVARTYGTPTNAVAGRKLKISMRNTGGGAIAHTFPAVMLLDGGGTTGPSVAAGKRIVISFECTDGTNWEETDRTGNLG